MNARTLPIHQSLHRHAHVLGAERELVMTSALIALLVGVGGLTAVSIVSANLLDRVRVRAAAHGKGRPDYEPRLTAAYQATGVLPGQGKPLADFR